MPASISMTSPSRAICAAALGRLSSRFAPTRSTIGSAPSRIASRASAAAAWWLAGASNIANATASMQIGVRVVMLGAARAQGGAQSTSSCVAYSLQNTLHLGAHDAPRALFLDAITALLTEAASQFA